MGEDRRPNVGGRHLPEPEQQPIRDKHQLELDAKSLAKRAGADGHRGDSPADVKQEE